MTVRAVQKLNVLKLRIQTCNLNKMQPQTQTLVCMATRISLSGTLHTQNMVRDSDLQRQCVTAQNVCLSAVYESLNLVYERRIKGENL